MVVVCEKVDIPYMIAPLSSPSSMLVADPFGGNEDKSSGLRSALHEPASTASVKYWWDHIELDHMHAYSRCSHVGSQKLMLPDEIKNLPND